MNVNAWQGYRITEARSFIELIEKLNMEITEPAEVLRIDMKPSGAFYCITRPKSETPPRRRARPANELNLQSQPAAAEGTPYDEFA